MVVLYYILALLGQIGAAIAARTGKHVVRESRVVALTGDSTVQMAAVATIMEACGVGHRPLWACPTFFSPNQLVRVKTRITGGVERQVKTRTSGSFNTRRQALIWSRGPVTLWHELCHALQTDAMLAAKAPESGDSYWDLPCEVEARAVEALMVLSHHHQFWPAMASLSRWTRGDCKRVLDAVLVALDMDSRDYEKFQRAVEARYPGNFTGCRVSNAWDPKVLSAKADADKAAEAAVQAAHVAKVSAIEVELLALAIKRAELTAKLEAAKAAEQAAEAKVAAAAAALAALSA